MKNSRDAVEEDPERTRIVELTDALGWGALQMLLHLEGREVAADHVWRTWEELVSPRLNEALHRLVRDMERMNPVAQAFYSEVLVTSDARKRLASEGRPLVMDGGAIRVAEEEKVRLLDHILDLVSGPPARHGTP